MYKEFLESSEFYNRRYHNFSSRIIVPIAILIFLISVFLCFAKKELTISTNGVIEPYLPIATIQSTSNDPIKVNNLSENKIVKKGDLLIKYENEADIVQSKIYSEQLSVLKKKTNH